jgi:hypothetical protein
MAVPTPGSAARRRVWLLLTLVGLLLGLVAVVGVVAGLVLAERIYALLPPLTIDQAAVGGAAFALGLAAALLGVVHLGAGVLVRRGVRAALVPVTALCAAMGVLAIAWAAAALVSAAAGTGAPTVMLPAGTALLVLALGYAWAVADLIGLRALDRGTD